jgi:hypothetical protein
LQWPGGQAGRWLHFFSPTPTRIKHLFEKFSSTPGPGRLPCVLSHGQTPIVEHSSNLFVLFQLFACPLFSFIPPVPY